VSTDDCPHCARLREENNEYAQINGIMQKLLVGVANALKGEPQPLHMHDWSDLPKVALQTVAEMGEAAHQAMELGFKVREYELAMTAIHEKLDIDPDEIIRVTEELRAKRKERS
jgi:hypothetical protein